MWDVGQRLRPQRARRGFARDMQDGSGTFGLYLPRHVVLFHVDDGSIRVDEVRVRPHG